GADLPRWPPPGPDRPVTRESRPRPLMMDPAPALPVPRRVAMPGAIAVIRDEHRAITAVISALQYLARAVTAGRAPDYEVLTVILEYVESFPNRLHHPKEDRYLFAALRARSAAATAILDELEDEHRRGDELTRELRYLLARCRVGGAEARTAFGAAVDRYANF